MRIVHLTQSTTAEITGGMEFHIAYLTDALRQQGHEVIVVNTLSFARKSPPRAAKQRKSQPFEARHGSHVLPRLVRHEWDSLCETLAMFMHRSLKSPSAKAIADYVESLKPDIVHQHSYIGGLGLCRRIAKKTPVVFTNHTGAYLHLDRMSCTRWLQRQLMTQFTAVIGPSQELVPRTNNSHYIPNGVDLAKFFPLSSEERRGLEVKFGCTGKQVFICPRRWAPTKGIIYLAKALRLLSRSTLEKCAFIFAGNRTPGYDRYQEHVQDILDTIEGDVRVLGNLDHKELAELLNISRACVVPSLMEATSLACLESMACGTPVLGTEATGLVELIRHEENGWLLPPRDEKALAARIEAIVAMSGGELQRLGAEAQETVRERYTWKTAALRTEEVYMISARKWQESLGHPLSGCAVEITAAELANMGPPITRT